jgi:kynurenine formamidase
LYLQTGTQIDSLGHMRHYEHGFYNGAGDESVNSGDRLGIDQWARSCIVGRAVLIDIPRYLSNAGLPDLDYRSNAPITVRLLDDALSAQKTARLPGDMVLIRTGWLNFYFSTMSPAERAEFPGAPRCPGLQQSHDTLAWLWNSQVSLLAADNIGVEAFPPLADSPLNLQAPIDSGVPSGAMHLTMIPLLGLVLGELWWLDDLASDCAEDEVYEMLLVAKPLNIVGGVGSPANVTAIK